MTDLEFVQRCTSGDKRSWDEFVDRYSRLIYNYIHKALESCGSGSSREDTVSDLFQEIFLLLSRNDYAKLKTFRGRNGCTLASWLRQVVLHATIDHLRGQKKTISIDEDNNDGSSLSEVLADNNPSVREVLAHQDTLANLAECIQALASDERFFLELHLHQHLGAAGLARTLRISRAAVDMRKSRIVDKLKDCFKRKGFLLDF